MISFILIGITALMFVYGVYVVFKGRVRAGSDGGEITGWSARKIGIIYMLAPFIAYINWLIVVLFLFHNGVSMESLENDFKYTVVYLFIVAATLYVFLLAIVKLSKRLYLKENSDDFNNP
ncbi:MAG: hypothetical protein ACRBHB_15985 [Arenicella sp.]